MDVVTETADAAAPHPAPRRRRSRVGLVVGALAGATVFGLVLAVNAIGEDAPTPAGSARFPTEVATYSWTVPHGAPAAPVSLVYQNGVGVEFLDAPQMIALAADGRTYRRLADAEARSIGVEQGDPAPTVLSADGTFGVVGGADAHGSVEIVSFTDGGTREVPIGDGRSVVPLSIDGEGRRVLVVTSESTLSPYLDANGRIGGDLGILDLRSERVRDLAMTDVGSAALSADGTRVAAIAASGAVLVDVATGSSARLAPVGPEARIPDDAWSPDGSKIAVLDAGGVHVLAVDDPSPQPATAAVASGSAGVAMLGWRDDDTLLVQIVSDDGGSHFAWVDVATAAQTVFSTYRPGFTGASVSAADAARHVVPQWDVGPIPADQGSGAALLAAVAGGVGVALITWPIAAAIDRRRRDAVTAT